MNRPPASHTLLPVVALALAGCGSDDPVVDGVWARTSPMATDVGAVYFEITTDDADVLVGASVDPSIAGDAQIHETTADDRADEAADTGDMDDTDDMDDTGDEAGSEDMSATDHADHVEMQMAMQPTAAGVDLPAGGTVSFGPGSLHVMLLDLVEPLETGDTFELTLDFAGADDIIIEVPVRESAP